MIGQNQNLLWQLLKTTDKTQFTTSFLTSQPSHINQIETNTTSTKVNITIIFKKSHKTPIYLKSRLIIVYLEVIDKQNKSKLKKRIWKYLEKERQLLQRIKREWKATLRRMGWAATATRELRSATARGSCEVRRRRGSCEVRRREGAVKCDGDEGAVKCEDLRERIWEWGFESDFWEMRDAVSETLREGRDEWIVFRNEKGFQNFERGQNDAV